MTGRWKTDLVIAAIAMSVAMLVGILLTAVVAMLSIPIGTPVAVVATIVGYTTALFCINSKRVENLARRIAKQKREWYE